MIRFLLSFIFTSSVILNVLQTTPLFVAAPGSPVAVGEGSGRILLADINGDARVDLVTAHLQKHFISIQLGDGSGRFAPLAGSPLSLAYAPGDIKLGDFNSDTLPDLGVTNSDRDEIDLFFNDGKGRFSRSSRFAIHSERVQRVLHAQPFIRGLQ